MSLEMHKQLKKKLFFSIRKKGHNIMISAQMCRVMYIHQKQCRSKHLQQTRSLRCFITFYRLNISSVESLFKTHKRKNTFFMYIWNTDHVAGTMYSAKYEHSYTDITTLDDYQASSTVKLEQVNISVSKAKSIPFPSMAFCEIVQERVSFTF